MANGEAERASSDELAVSLRPQRRGPAHAGQGLPRDKWVGARLWKMLVASLLLHVLISPAPLLLGMGTLLSLLPPPAATLPPEEELDAIPLDLLNSDLDPGGGALDPVSPPPAPEAPAAPSPDGLLLPPPVAPAVTSPEPKVEARPATPKPVPAASEPGPQKEGAFGDPVALSGSAGELADSNAHVRILIYTDVIRAHPLGPRVGGLLRRTPQWRDFFGPAGIDPVRDIDRVLIAGPQLRDSSNVVAVVEHHLPEAAIEGALERLVERSGTWLRREPPLARARADRAERVFAAPRPGVVAVAPLSAEASVRRLGPGLRFGAAPAGVALQVFIDTPYRPLAAAGLRIPESVAWLRAEVLPQEGGGVQIRLLLKDASPKEARQHAKELQTALRSAVEVDFSRMGSLGALASLAFGGPKQKMVEKIDLFAERDQIRGLIEMTREQLLNLSDLLDAFLPPEPRAAPTPEVADTKDQDQEEPGTGTAPATANGTAEDTAPVSGDEKARAPSAAGDGAPIDTAPSERPPVEPSAPPDHAAGTEDSQDPKLVPGSPPAETAP